MLTKKQRALLMLIHDHLEKNGITPSFEEMKNAVGLKSKSGIHRLIAELQERGYVKTLPRKARALEIVKMPEDWDKQNVESIVSTNDNMIEIPLYGKIAAGVPLEAISGTETIAIPSSMLGTGEHYALTVAGDSMIEAGILNEDTVIIKNTTSIENGEIGVALVDGNEVTLKKIWRHDHQVSLEPCNKNYETRTFDASRVRVQGKLVGLIRNYN
ncbi:MAG: transcriptional repressor LexA [Alphaproteobacteria bacterium]|nr:transcriptional repressor LexA [Alphaproteobacteria bacterium]